MKLVLLSSALFQMLLGVVAFVWVGVLGAEQIQKERGTIIERGFVLLYVLPGPCLLLGLGGVQCALTRLAYPASQPGRVPAAGPMIAPEVTEPANSPRTGKRLMERVLEIIALSQFGAGLIVYVCGCYVIFRDEPRFRTQTFTQTWLVAVTAWVLASLGGILWALTRIAYPRATRPG